MPSFDIVSEVDMQEVRNAVDQAVRELRNRFDFRNIDAGFELIESGVRLHAPEDFQLGQLEDILRDKFAARDVDGKSLVPGDTEGLGKVRRRLFTLKQGIDRDTAKIITKLVKKSKSKIQAQVNGDKLRITAKKRDDLQGVMAEVKALELDTPFQFNNFRD
ncbi:MAG: YajQ family cyclic di-GMP-binding protein [Gammaproteobacteria bacterium]|nr:YajQ family cyclic di-GMP-binding protein [Gammaproteobacteria bacterium]